MNTEAQEVIVGRFLATLQDDWAPANALSSIVERVGVDTPAANRDLCLSLVQEGLDAGWFRVGMVTRVGFAPWKGTLSEVMNRLSASWPTFELPDLGTDPCWFECSVGGREHLASLRQRLGKMLDDTEGYGYFRITSR